MTTDQLALWVGIVTGIVGIISTIISGFFSAYQADQAKKQRRMDYLREQQKSLREAKANYDAWIPVWNTREGDSNPARNGAYHCSLAQSVMFSINDKELNILAKQLNLFPGTEEVVLQNQKVLEQAIARFATLLIEDKNSWDFAEQH